MKKKFAAVMLLLVCTTIVFGIMTSTVVAEENYQDISNEHSNGPGAPPEEGMQRDEPRTLAKD
jgi:uncharacterized alpha/beta hydrolase family protein